MTPVRPYKPVILFEGPDKVGKTTAAQKLAKAIGAVYVHNGPYAGLSARDLSAIYSTQLEFALRGICPVVMDRGWPSEQVYGLVMRDGSRLDNEAVELLERLMAITGGFVAMGVKPLQSMPDDYATDDAKRRWIEGEFIKWSVDERRRVDVREYDFIGDPDAFTNLMARVGMILRNN